MVRNGSGARQFLLYRELVDSQPQALSRDGREELREVVAMVVVEGRVMDVVV